VIVDATLVEWKMEADHDLQLVLADPSRPSATLVAEIPDPSCRSVASSPEEALFASARQTVVAKLGEPREGFQPAGFSVRVDGITFFDKVAHGNGHAPNGIEIHPILKIRFLD